VWKVSMYQQLHNSELQSLEIVKHTDNVYVYFTLHPDRVAW
jgi:hypothetical protein